MNNTIRVYGADFCPAGGGAGCSGTVTYATLGTAPNRSFVVTWNNVREWNSGTSLFNVQIILYENGEFALQYKDVSNVSGGVGQIGYQISTTDYGLYDTTGIASMAYSAVRFFLPPATWAEYRLDECSGTSVADSSGNSYDATMINGPVPGSSGALCKGVAFDGSNDYIRLPAGFPNMAASFTITAWIHTTHDWVSGGQKDMRIFTDDENNTGGYSFSLGDGGWDYDSGGIPAGRLRFYNRSLNPVIFDSPPRDPFQHLVLRRGSHRFRCQPAFHFRLRCRRQQAQRNLSGIDGLLGNRRRPSRHWWRSRWHGRRGAAMALQGLHRRGQGIQEPAHGEPVVRHGA
jgi:hypothetical protein